MPIDDHTARGEQTEHYPGSPCSNQMDIRQFLKDGHGVGSDMFKHVPCPNKWMVEEPIDKMRIIRNKMVEDRRAADRDKAMETRTKKSPMKERKGEQVVHAKDVNNAVVKDHHEVVVVGPTSRRCTRTWWI